VHPTWRDLVIERLAGDADLRRHFLSRCGPHGVVLALSTAGGAQGERSLPLIARDADWDALGDRIYALLPELDHAELATVLRAILNTIQVVTTDGMAAGEARVLARMALERSARLWAEAGAPVLLDCVDAWLSLSDHLDPPVSAEFLGPTWAELLPAGLPDPEDLVEVQRFTEWMTLRELVHRFSAQRSLALASEVRARVERDRQERTGVVPEHAWEPEELRAERPSDHLVRRVLTDL
jgi:hypothetical protein